MKSKVLNLLLILTSLFGYLEWGKDNSSFLFQAEAEVLSKVFSDPVSAIHPFTVIPLIGQLILLVTLFQKKTNKYLTFISMAAIGLLLAFMFVIGIVSLNYKIALSTIPFLFVAYLAIQYHRRQ